MGEEVVTATPPMGSKGNGAPSMSAPRVGNSFAGPEHVVADPGSRHVPPYYQLAPIHDDAPDVMLVCVAMGLNVKDYLVVETISKLHRYDKKGTALQDLDKAIEQISRLRAMVAEELDAVTLEESKQRNRSGTLAACVLGGDCRTPSQCLEATGGCNRTCKRNSRKRCPSFAYCQLEGCQL